MSFWSTLAGIGTSLIPGVGPLIAPLVAGGVSALTGGGGSPASTNNGAVGVNPTFQKSPYVQEGVDALKQGIDATAPAANYYKTALGGDRDALSSLLGPEVSTVLSQYDNAAKTAAEFAPRGGGANQVLAETPFKKVGAYGQALAGARSKAAAGSAGIARDIVTAGGDIGRLGTSEESAQNSFATSLARLNVERQNEQAKQISGLTGGIGSILANIFAGKSKGGGSKTPGGGFNPRASIGPAPPPGYDPGLLAGTGNPGDYTGI